MKHALKISTVTFILLSSFAWADSSKNSKHAEHDDHEHGESGQKNKSHAHEDEGEDEHGHENEKKHEEHGHKEEEGHAHGEEKGHGHEESSRVGPDKGILAASEEQGIKLSPEAMKNFEIKTQRLSGGAPWSLPISARVQTGEETNFYRVRDGFFKRVDFVQVEKDKQQIILSSKDLKEGDEVVVGGVGYLRIAEVAAFGGAPEGHSH